MIPSPRVGSGVDVRQISTFWNVKMPKRSNWVPLEVTVKLRLIPAHEPGSPQSVGGLWEGRDSWRWV